MGNPMGIQSKAGKAQATEKREPCVNGVAFLCVQGAGTPLVSLSPIDLRS